MFTPKRWRLWHNFPQKLGALIAAIILWFAATADRRATITRTYDVPLVLNGIDKSHVVTGQPKTVRVTLEADRTRLETLSVNLIEATADVGELDDGFFTKPVTVNEPDGAAKTSSAGRTARHSPAAVARKSDSLTVRRPRGLQISIFVVGQLAEVLAVDVDDEEIANAAARPAEGELAVVRRPDRPGQSARRADAR